MRITGTSRCAEVREAIIARIRESGAVDQKLPPEGELARSLGVSVATVREALRQLDRDGYVTKRHGSGNYIHRSTLGLDMRIDNNRDFFALLGGRYQEVS